MFEGGVYGPKILVENGHHFRALLGDPDHKETQTAEVEDEGLQIVFDIGIIPRAVLPL